MLDPGKDPSTFDVIADDVSCANACWPDRISNLLISDLWRDKFDPQSLGWNEYKACLVLFDEPYDPDEPSRWVSKSVAREADRGRPGTFRPMSRDIALNMLEAVNEPLVSGIYDEAGKPKFRLLAEIELRRFGAKAQEILSNIAITNDARSQFCDWHGLKRPKSDERALTPDNPDGAVKEKPQPSPALVSKDGGEDRNDERPEPEQPEHGPSAVRPNRRGRKKGIGGYDSKDMPLIEEMHRLIEIEEVTGPWDAALKVVDEAPGAPNIDSRLKRLTRKYAAKYSPDKGLSD